MHLRVSNHAISTDPTNMRVDASVATEPAYVSPPIFPGNDDRHKTNPATDQEVPLFQQPAAKESQNESAYPL